MIIDRIIGRIRQSREVTYFFWHGDFNIAIGYPTRDGLRCFSFPDVNPVTFTTLEDLLSWLQDIQLPVVEVEEGGTWIALEGVRYVIKPRGSSPSLPHILVELGIATSVREARTFLAAGAVKMNDEKVSENSPWTYRDFNLALLTRGKKKISGWVVWW